MYEDVGEDGHPLTGSYLVCSLIGLYRSLTSCTCTCPNLILNPLDNHTLRRALWKKSLPGSPVRNDRMIGRCFLHRR
jgi:hypothetical protein